MGLFVANCNMHLYYNPNRKRKRKGMVLPHII